MISQSSGLDSSTTARSNHGSFFMLSASLSRGRAPPSLLPSISSSASKKKMAVVAGQVATVAQLVGVDAGSLITMIAEAAQTVRRNRATCLQLARRVEMIGALLRRLHDHDHDTAEIMHRPETRSPVEELEDTLRRAYLLVRSCQRRGYAYRCFMGARHADELREVQGEIAFYLQLFPLVTYVDATLNWVRHLNNKASSDSDSSSPSSRQEAPMGYKVISSEAQMPEHSDKSLSLASSNVEEGRVDHTCLQSFSLVL